MDWKGYAGGLLRIDLTNGTIEDYPIQEIVGDYLGGKGLGARLLYDEVKAGIHPLAPENILMILTGPFANHRIPGGTRYLVVTKSPLTNGWGDANGAGRLGPMIKQAGYDGILVEGKAKKPVYIWVGPEGAEIRGAQHLWGLDTGAFRDAIRRETHRDAEVASIGIAGEKMVPYACIISEYNRAAGRSGTGAVMGSKNLKGIAFYGTKRQTVAYPEDLKKLVREMIGLIKTDPTCNSFKAYGTAVGILPHNYLGMFPAYNFREGVSKEIEKVSGEYMAKTILIRRDTCKACPVRCRRVVKVDGMDERYGGPELETIGALGTCTGLFDLPLISRANELCNRVGLDTINTGLSISWAMECYEKGLLTKEDTDGLDLSWGNGESILTLIERIAHQKGIGLLLGKGLKKASQELCQGSHAFALQVKNQSFPVHMPRGKIGQGLSYATSNRGACHCQGMHDTSIEGGKIMPSIGIHEGLSGISRLSKENKPLLESLAQNYRAAQDSLIICRFVSWDYGPTTPDQLLLILRAVTGIEMDTKGFMQLGERVFNLCRLFNVRGGMDRKDDTLPERMGESLPEGATSGSVITQGDLGDMLDEYYHLRGWSRDGIPKEETLKRLGLEKDDQGFPLKI